MKRSVEYKEKQKIYQRHKYAERREYAVAALGGKCRVCGAISALEIDHINPELKSLKVFQMYKASESLFLLELAKCQLLCRTCHHKKSMKERLVIPYTHGTYSMYNKHGCRCQICKEKMALSARERRKRKMAA